MNRYASGVFFGAIFMGIGWMLSGIVKHPVHANSTPCFNVDIKVEYGVMARESSYTVKGVVCTR